MRVLIFLFLLTFSSIIYAQESDVIRVVPGTLGNLNLVYKGRKLTQDQIGGALHPILGARESYKKGRRLRTQGSITGFVGGFFLGTSLYYVVGSNRDVKRWVPIAGAGLSLLSIPLLRSGKKNILKAVNLYNLSLAQVPDLENQGMEFSLNLESTGVGLSLLF